MTVTTNITNRLDYEFDLSKVQNSAADWADSKIKSSASGTTTGSAEDMISAKPVGAPATSKTSLSAGEQEIARLVGAAETTVTSGKTSKTLEVYTATIDTDSLTKKYAINYAVADGTVNGAKVDSAKMVDASSTTVSNQLSDNILEAVRLTGGSSSSTTYYYSTTFDTDELMAETVSWNATSSDFAAINNMTGETAINVTALYTANNDLLSCANQSPSMALTIIN